MSAIVITIYSICCIGFLVLLVGALGYEVYSGNHLIVPIRITSVETTLNETYYNYVFIDKFVCMYDTITSISCVENCPKYNVSDIINVYCDCLNKNCIFYSDIAIIKTWQMICIIIGAILCCICVLLSTITQCCNK